MKWVKAPEELKGVLAAGMEGIDCEKRLMFGYPAYFINSNMFSGLFQASVFIRLSPDQLASLKKRHPSIAALEPMPGRPMKDYFVIPEVLYKDLQSFGKVAAEAAEYAKTLPAKKKAAKKKSARGS